MAAPLADIAARLETRGWRISLRDPKLAEMTGFADFPERVLLVNCDADSAIGLVLTVEDELTALGRGGRTFYTVDPDTQIWARTDY